MPITGRLFNCFSNGKQVVPDQELKDAILESWEDCGTLPREFEEDLTESWEMEITEIGYCPQCGPGILIRRRWTEEGKLKITSSCRSCGRALEYRILERREG